VKKQQIKPNPNCNNCFGWGTIYDTVDYGSTTAQLPSFCACVEEQADEDTDEIELIFDPIQEGVEEDFDEEFPEEEDLGEYIDSIAEQDADLDHGLEPGDEHYWPRS
jgi:hypothetical protein